MNTDICFTASKSSNALKDGTALLYAERQCKIFEGFEMQSSLCKTLCAVVSQSTNYFPLLIPLSLSLSLFLSLSLPLSSSLSLSLFLSLLLTHSLSPSPSLFHTFSISLSFFHSVSHSLSLSFCIIYVLIFCFSSFPFFSCADLFLHLLSLNILFSIFNSFHFPSSFLHSLYSITILTFLLHFIILSFSFFLIFSPFLFFLFFFSFSHFLLTKTERSEKEN